MELLQAQSDLGEAKAFLKALGGVWPDDYSHTCRLPREIPLICCIDPKRSRLKGDVCSFHLVWSHEVNAGVSQGARFHYAYMELRLNPHPSSCFAEFHRTRVIVEDEDQRFTMPRVTCFEMDNAFDRLEEFIFVASPAKLVRQPLWQLLYECMDPLPREMIDLVMSYLTLSDPNTKKTGDLEYIMTYRKEAESEEPDTKKQKLQ